MRAIASFLLLSLAAAARAERCETSSVTLHCQSRCAGLNETSYSSTNPSPEQVFSGKALSSGASAQHALMVEPLPQQGGSPTVPTQPSDVEFSNQTVYAPAHRALSPDQLMAIVGPASAVEWVPLDAAGFACVDGRHARAGLYAYGGDLGEFALALTVLRSVRRRRPASSKAGCSGCTMRAASSSRASTPPPSRSSPPPSASRPICLWAQRRRRRRRHCSLG